jgi:capsular polysaccharide transport system permease protein
MPQRTDPVAALPQGAARMSRGMAAARSIAALALREMATTHGRSPGGYLWALAEPMAGIALLTLIFSAGFKTPSLGVSFALFYATGLLPFLMFTDVSGKVATALLFSKPLLAYPAVGFLDAILARFLVNAMTQLLIAYLILTGILLAFETRVVPDYPVLVRGFAWALALSAGVGVMNCWLFTRFAVWQRIWAIAMRPMFILSCIFFVFEGIPQPYRDALWFNPLVHVVGLVRRGMYAGYDAAYVSEAYLGVLCLGLACGGLVFLRRYHRDLLCS